MLIRSPTMRIPALLLAAASLIHAAPADQVTTGQLGDATENLNNPSGAAYRAVTKDNKMGVKGMITAISSDGKGTDFAVEMSGLPTEGGPFSYHIHVMPVPEDGNCTSTLAHLDPFLRGEDPACTEDRPETCQVGDLAGKYGKANGTSFQASYTDPYVSLKDGMGAFFGNRSFVIHFANKTRLACGNFESLAVGAQAPGASSSSSSSGASAQSATLVPVQSNSAASSTSSGAASTVSGAASTVTEKGRASASSSASSTTGSSSTSSSSSSAVTNKAAVSTQDNQAAATSTTLVTASPTPTSTSSPAQVSANAASSQRSLSAFSIPICAALGLFIWS